MKTKFPLTPNFTISEDAINNIKDWIDRMSTKKDRSLVSAIFIIRDMSGENMDVPRPAIGAYNLEDVDEGQIFKQNGLSFAFPVIETDYELFDCRILDYVNGRYVLI